MFYLFEMNATDYSSVETIPATRSSSLDEMPPVNKNFQFSNSVYSQGALLSFKAGVFLVRTAASGTE